MTSFNPYITFDGCCEAALNFYSSCFNGEIIFVQYSDEFDAVENDGSARKIMHSEFQAGTLKFMACDATPGQTLHPGTNISLYAGFGDRAELENVFENLSTGGVVHMPIQTTFWGASLGILTDRFNIHWMVVLDK